MEPQPRKVVYPLNSRRISLVQLRQLAQALGLPVTASNADLQVMVEEKLRELERDPKSVQLVVNEISDGLQSLELQDENGTFLETTTLDSSKASTPAEVHETYSSLSSSRESIVEQFTEPHLVVKKPSVSQEGLETVDTEVGRLEQLVEEHQLTTTEYKHLLSTTEERVTVLLANNQQLTESLAEAEVRLARLTTENEALRHRLIAYENLEQELQEKQSQIKKLWKQNCDQVQEFDYIIGEKNRELESLKKELETKSVTMELPIQLSTELPVGARGTNVDGHLPTTVGLQSATLLHPIKVPPSSGLAPTLSQPLLQSIKMPPPITTCVLLVTAGQTTIPSQLPGMVPSSFVLPTSHHTEIPTVSLSSQGGRTVTSVWTPQTVSYSARPMEQTPETNPMLMRTAPLVSLAEPPVAPSPTLLTVQRRGKAPPQLIHLMGKTVKSGSMTGYQHWKGLPPGMVGRKMRD